MEGFDAQRKLVLSANIAFGVSVPENEVPCFGISGISAQDIAAFKRLGLVCKLIAHAERTGGGVSACVEPMLFPVSGQMAHVNGADNLISLTADRVGVQRRPDNRAMERALAEGDLRAIADAVANAFEPPVLAQFPQVGRIKDALTSHGALCAQLTGTGSVVFGLFDNEPAAKAAASALGGWVAHPVDAAAQHPD